MSLSKIKHPLASETKPKHPIAKGKTSNNLATKLSTTPKPKQPCFRRGVTGANAPSGSNNPLSHTPVIGFLDVDAFETEAWRRENRFKNKRNVPCIVAHDTSHRVLAASYEAKALGINRNDTPKVQDARAKFKDVYIFWKKDKFGKQDNYKTRKATFDLMQAIQGFCSKLGGGIIIENSSSDEVFLDISAEVTRGMEKRAADPQKKNEAFVVPPTVVWEQAKVSKKGPFSYYGPESRPRINDYYFYRNKNDQRLMFGVILMDNLCRHVEKETGMRCSAGVACNKLMAKVGCGLNRPQRTTVVGTHSVSRISKKIELTKIPGLGGQDGKRLMEIFNVSTMSEIRAIPYNSLLKEFGKEMAQQISGWAKGTCNQPVHHRLMKEQIRCNKPANNIRRLGMLTTTLNNLRDEVSALLKEEEIRHKRTTEKVKVEWQFQYIAKRQQPHPNQDGQNINIEIDDVGDNLEVIQEVIAKKEVALSAPESTNNVDPNDQMDNSGSSTGTPKDSEAEETNSNNKTHVIKYVEIEISESGSEYFDIRTKKRRHELPKVILHYLKSLPNFNLKDFKITELAFVLRDFKPVLNDRDTNNIKYGSNSTITSSEGDAGVDEVDNNGKVKVPDTLKVHTKKNDTYETPKFTITQKLGSFRTLPYWKYSSDPKDTQLPKILPEDKLDSLIGKDLGINFKKNHNKMIKDHVKYFNFRQECFIKWSKETKFPKEDKPEFVCFNGRIAETLKTPANKKYGEWTIFAKNIDGTIFLWEEKNMRPLKMQNIKGYYGNYFERLVTSESGSVDAVHECDHIYVVNDVKFGKHKLRLVSDMDAETEDNQRAQVSVFCNEFSDPTFKADRELKVWGVTVTSGAEVVLKGSRTKEGILEGTKLFTTDEYAATIDADLDACYEFEDRFLHWIKAHLPKSDPTLVKKFTWTSSRQRNVNCETYHKDAKNSATGA